MSERDRRWLDRHGLEHDPFQDMDAGAGFFARGTRERLIEQLADADDESPPLVTIVGEKGIGRTSLLHALLRRLSADAQVARVNAGVFLSVKDLLVELARAFGAEVEPYSTRPQLGRSLHADMRAWMDAGGRRFVLVDDAGELEGDALDELVRVAELDPGGGRVRVLLFALPGIRDALNAASGAERVRPLLHELRIERFSLNELRGYLQFRLARAGLEGASPFREHDVAAIHRESQGVPARVNVVAGRMLREMAAGSSPRPYFLAAGAATLVLAAVVLLWRGVDGTPHTESAAPATAAATATASPPAALPASTLLVAPTPRVLGDAERKEAGPWIEADPAPLIEPVVELAGSLPEALEDDPAEARTSPASPSVATDADEPNPGEPNLREPNPGEPNPGEPTSAEAEPAPPEWAPGHFVLQVLVSSTSERARAFIAARPDPEAYRFYERSRNGALQYVVLQGDHATQGDAARAIAAVEEETGLAPFVRSVADVRRELGESGSLLRSEAPVGLTGGPSNP